MRTLPRMPLLVAAASMLVAALAVAIVLTSSGSSSRHPSGESSASSGFDGAALPGSPLAPDFALTDAHGHEVSLARYRGRVVMLSFVYSTCGANCVLLAQQVRGALDELTSPTPPTPVIFVSADPTADTPASVAHFLSQVSLGGRVEYLTGPPGRLRETWRSYHVSPAGSGGKAFERSLWVMLIDGRGHERVLFGLEQLTPEALAHDIRALESRPPGYPTDP